MSVIITKCDKTMFNKGKIKLIQIINIHNKSEKNSHFPHCQNPFLHLPEVKDQNYKTMITKMSQDSKPN